jgi:hypothetical protein
MMFPSASPRRFLRQTINGSFSKINDGSLQRITLKVPETVDGR